MQQSFWRRIVEAGTRVLLPEVCAGCGIAGAWICSECWSGVVSIDQKICCSTCGHPTTSPKQTCGRCDPWPGLPFQVRTAFVFTGAVRQSIIRMKYHDEYARATWHAIHLSETIQAANWHGADMLVPVPLHSRKLRSRGYNQSEKLAKGAAQLLNVEMSGCLSRLRETESQTRLGRADRWSNVSGAFTCSVDVRGRRVLLIDDVMTTGATIHACAQALLDAGAGQVRGLTLATEI